MAKLTSATIAPTDVISWAGLCAKRKPKQRTIVEYSGRSCCVSFVTKLFAPCSIANGAGIFCRNARVGSALHRSASRVQSLIQADQRETQKSTAQKSLS